MISGRVQAQGRTPALARRDSFVPVLLSVLLALAMSLSLPVKAHAQSALEWYGQGLEALRSGKNQQAADGFRRAIALDPKLAKARGALGTLYFQLGRLEEAEEYLVRAQELDPGMVQAAVNLAELYARTDRARTAISAYQEIARSHPDLVRAHVGLGSAYQRAQRFAEAATAYAQALKLDPSSAECMANLGSCHEALSDEDRAIQWYKAAIEKSPELAMARANLGGIFQKRGELDHALPLLNEAIRLDPKLTGARYSLALLLLEKSEFDKAAKELEAVLSREPDHVGAHYNLARAYFRLNRTEEGKRETEAHRRFRAIAEEIEQCQKAAAGEPNNPARQLELGRICLEHGKPRASIDAYRAAIALDASSAGAHAGLGDAYRSAGQGKLAFVEYQDALRLDPQAHAAMDGIARIHLARQERLDEAVGLATRAFAVRPLPRYLETVALAHLGAGRQQEARNAIQAAIEMDRPNPSFQKTLERIVAGTSHQK